MFYFRIFCINLSNNNLWCNSPEQKWKCFNTLYSCLVYFTCRLAWLVTFLCFEKFLSILGRELEHVESLKPYIFAVCIFNEFCFFSFKHTIAYAQHSKKLYAWMLVCCDQKTCPPRYHYMYKTLVQENAVYFLYLTLLLRNRHLFALLRFNSSHAPLFKLPMAMRIYSHFISWIFARNFCFSKSLF